MEQPAFQAAKHAIQVWTGLEKDALHVYVGLGVYLCTRALTRAKRRPWLAWAAVLAVALLGEALDLRDDLMGPGHWRWKDSAHDIVNTLFWPTVLSLRVVWGMRRSAAVTATDPTLQARAHAAAPGPSGAERPPTPEHLI